MVRIASGDGGVVGWVGVDMRDDLGKQLAFLFDILISHVQVEVALVTTRNVCKACISTRNDKVKVTAGL